jgi:tetratricopeptide (TPR) repeat protein
MLSKSGLLSVFSGVKNNPHIAAPVVTVLASAAIQFPMSYFTESRRRNQEEKQMNHHNKFVSAENALKAGLELMDRGEYYNATQFFKESTEHLNAYCQDGVSGNAAESTKKLRSILYYCHARALFHLSKYAENKDAPKSTSLLILDELFKIDAQHKDGLNLQGLIHLRMAYFQDEPELYEKAAIALQASFNKEEQPVISLLLLFAKQNMLNESKGEASNEIYTNIIRVNKNIDKSSQEPIITNELMLICGLAYKNCGDNYNALRYFKCAIKCTPNLLSYFSEKAKVLKLVHEIYSVLEKLPNDKHKMLFYDILPAYKNEFFLNATEIKTRLNRSKEKVKELEEVGISMRF